MIKQVLFWSFLFSAICTIFYYSESNNYPLPRIESQFQGPTFRGHKEPRPKEPARFIKPLPEQAPIGSDQPNTVNRIIDVNGRVWLVSGDIIGYIADAVDTETEEMSVLALFEPYQHVLQVRGKADMYRVAMTTAKTGYDQHGERKAFIVWPTN